MLSDRRRKVLNALIEEYISTASPVSSRAIVGNHSLGVSSATVRNELYVLEEDGYVVSPHVSSGRIPTDTGYRTFVDELLSSIPKNDESEKQGDDSIADELKDSAEKLDDLLKQTSKALNHFTDCLAVVMAPRVTKISLQQISLVKIDSTHVICVLVVKDGRVVNTVVELDEPRSAEEICVLEAMLNKEFEIKGSFDPLAKDDDETATDSNSTTISSDYKRSQADNGADHGHGHRSGRKNEGGSSGSSHNRSSHQNRSNRHSTPTIMGDASSKKDLQKLVDAINDELFDEECTRLHFNGVENLFSQPEMQKMSLAMGFARLLDDDLTMFRLLGDFVSMKGLDVRIGHENNDESLGDISVVASSYGSQDRKGTIAIVGPTRMDYGKIIDAVRFASSYLDNNIKGKE